MIVKVLIKRRFRMGIGSDVIDQLKKMRGEAMQQPGYISGETLIGADDRQTMLVISTWQNAEDWESWCNSDKRRANEAFISQYLEEPSSYEVFLLGN